MQHSRMWMTAMLLTALAPWPGWSTAEAQLTRILPAEAAPARPAWAGELAGWQLGPGGAQGNHSWHIAPDGSGSITLPGPARTGGRRLVERRFQLTAAEHARFAALIDAVVAAPQTAALCRADAPRAMLRRGTGEQAEVAVAFDHGCEDSANTARQALLAEALAILREAASREEG